MKNLAVLMLGAALTFGLSFNASACDKKGKETASKECSSKEKKACCKDGKATAGKSACCKSKGATAGETKKETKSEPATTAKKTIN
jgi:hypothetical protein